MVCFCTISFIFIQSQFFFQCKSNPNEFAPMLLIQCEEMIQNLKVTVGFISSAALTTIVCIVSLISRKKSAMIFVSMASLLGLFFLIQEMTHCFPPIGPGKIPFVLLPYKIECDFAASRIWPFVFFAVISSAITWPIVIFRNKIMMRIRK